jgi:hypothetical protein
LGFLRLNPEYPDWSPKQIYNPAYKVRVQSQIATRNRRLRKRTATVQKYVQPVAKQTGQFFSNMATTRYWCTPTVCAQIEGWKCTTCIYDLGQVLRVMLKGSDGDQARNAQGKLLRSWLRV